MSEKRRGRPKMVATHHMKAAYLAGRGHSAGFIADEIGADDPALVYAILSKHSLKLLAKASNQEGVQLAILKTAMKEIENLSIVRRVDSLWLAARLIEKIASERLLLIELCEEILREAPRS